MKAYIALNAFLLAIAVSGAALPPRQANTPTLPAGAGPKCTNVAGQNPGNLAGAGLHKQFATGCCLSDADCENGCCGKLTGICQDPGVATLPAVGGCGGVFGSGGGAAPTSSPTDGPSSPEATTTASSPEATSAPPQTSNAPATGNSPCNASQDPGHLAGKGTGTQFITGCCDSDADCASGCCGKNNGVCQARAVAQGSKKIGGCGGQFTSKKMMFKMF